jgi:hypothetical protein
VAEKKENGSLLNTIKMGRLIRNIVAAKGMRPRRPSSSRKPAPNEMRMKDVLFLNFFWYKGHKTAPPSTRGRGVLHLIKFGIGNTCTKQKSWHDFAREVLPVPMKYREPKQTTFVVRVCEGVFMPKRNEGIKTPEAALKSLALS